ASLTRLFTLFAYTTLFRSGYFLENLKNVANDGSFPMFRGIINSLIVSTCTAALCTYFSSLTAYGLYAYDFKAKKIAFTFIMAILDRKSTRLNSSHVSISYA